MKFNLGIGIVIGMILFIGFIMFMVLRMITEDSFNHELVTEEYYAKEMVYQHEIDAEKNTQKLVEKIKSRKIGNGWEIVFPKELDPSKINGTLFLYRPSNKKLDRELPIVLVDYRLNIPNEYFLDGRWNITLEWGYEGEVYMYKESIIY